MFVVALTVAWRVGAGMLGVVLAVAVTAVAYRGRHVLDASLHPGTLSRDLSVVFSAVALAVAGHRVPTAALSQAAEVLAVAAALMILAAATRRRVRPAARVLVVGDRASISRAAMRWSDGGAVEVVAAVLTEPQPTEASPQSIVGVPTSTAWTASRHWFATTGSTWSWSPPVTGCPTASSDG